MATPKRNEAVAWRRRYICPQEGPSLWWHCDESDVPTLRAAGCYEVEPLYSQEQVEALQGEVSRLREALSVLSEACFSEFCGKETEANEPDDSKVSFPEDRCHITFGMIRNARKALNLEPPTDGR